MSQTSLLHRTAIVKTLLSKSLRNLQKKLTQNTETGYPYNIFYFLPKYLGIFNKPKKDKRKTDKIDSKNKKR